MQFCPTCLRVRLYKGDLPAFELQKSTENSDFSGNVATVKQSNQILISSLILSKSEKQGKLS